jgi:hypothetical protein
MRRRMRTIWRTVVRTAATVTAAELAASVARTVPLVGLVVADAYLAAYSTVPGLGVVAGVATLALVGWLFVSTAIGFVFVVALAIAWTSVSASVDALALDERGVTTTCTVVSVTVRVVTSSGLAQFGSGPPFGPGADPFGPGGPGGSSGSETTRTYYDHRLQCADEHLDAMTLDHRAADDGQQLGVVYDPTGRVSPHPAGELARPASATSTLWTAIVAMVLVGVVDGVWSHRTRW